MDYTLAQLNDLEQIRDLRRKYSHYYDRQQLDALCDLFSRDAVCQWDENHGGCWKGIPDIRRNYQRYFEKYPGIFSVLHITADHVVELLSSTTAKGSCFLLDYNFLKKERPNPLGTVGVYEDVYVKEGNCWKFQKMRLLFLWPERVIFPESR